MAKKKVSAARIAGTIALIVTGLYVVCVIGLTVFQRRLIYFPCHATVNELAGRAETTGFKPWQNARGEFIGWMRASQQGVSGRCVLLLHGNAACAPEWFHYADGFQELESCDFYILEYPGYDGRPGSPSEKTILRAAEDGFASLPPKCGVYIIGESLGTGVACYLTGKHATSVRGLFLVAPYTRISAVAKRHLPLFPVKLMLRDRYPAEEWLREFHGPLAVVLAEKDQVIPMELGRELFDGYRFRKKLWVEPGASHDDVHRPRAGLWKEILDFWNAASD